MLLLAVFLLHAPPSHAQVLCDRPCVGPSAGSVLVAGGGSLGDDILARFIELAGGPDAPIVVIPTAAADETFGPDWEEVRLLRAAGANNLTLLHTRDRRVADSEEFVAPLKTARGVWIPGGRQGKLADAYLGTRTQKALFEVLERGGVVGGSSAGASIMASYLVRGGVLSNDVVMVPGYEEGFGLLRNVAIDQHLIVRDRVTDLLPVLTAHPELLGIGLDEGTAMVVQGDRAQVVGKSSVAIYDPEDQMSLFYWLAPGDVFDLGTRTIEARFAPLVGPGQGG